MRFPEEWVANVRVVVLRHRPIVEYLAAVLTLVPFASGLLGYLLPQLLHVSPRLLVIVLGAGWSATTAILLFWFYWYRNHWLESFRDLAKAMFAPDKVVASLVAEGGYQQHNKELARSTIEIMLKHMIRLLASRVSASKKGASLLLLTGSEENAPFRLFAQVNHNSRDVELLASRLCRDMSFAGQALAKGECMVLEDSQQPPTNIIWIRTNEPALYRGRAAAPVYVSRQEGSLKELGVLCFDVQDRWELNDWDRQLMQLLASRIGSLWPLLNGPET